MYIFFVNSIRFATCLNKIFCNRRKTDGGTQKSKRKCFFFNKNVFDLNQKRLQVFQAFRLLKNTKVTRDDTQKI